LKCKFKFENDKLISWLNISELETPREDTEGQRAERTRVK